MHWYLLDMVHSECKYITSTPFLLSDELNLSFTNTRCFISDMKVLFGTFLAPIALVMIFNTIMLVLAVRILIKSAQKAIDQQVNDKNTKVTVVTIIGICCMMTLFGIAWTFGILSMNIVSNTFQILFAIFNVLQGFCYFAFVVLFKQEGLNFWINLLKSKSYKRNFVPAVVSDYNSSHPSHGRRDDGLELSQLDRKDDANCRRKSYFTAAVLGAVTRSFGLRKLDPIEQGKAQIVIMY